MPSELNLLPISNELTSWAQPVRRIWDDPVPLDAIVVDNLPSLLPLSASEDFSQGLLPFLPGLFDGGDRRHDARPERKAPTQAVGFGQKDGAGDEPRAADGEGVAELKIQSVQQALFDDGARQAVLDAQGRSQIRGA